jgi:hypothetical protein
MVTIDNVILGQNRRVRVTAEHNGDRARASV